MVRKASRGVRVIIRIAIGALFVYAGWVKLRQPQPAAEFLESVLYADLTWAVPLIALAEMTLGLWLLTGVRSDRAATAAFAMFISFGVLHGFANVGAEPVSSCGCLGDAAVAANWSSTHWILLNVLLATSAGAVALASRKTGEQPDHCLEKP